MGDTPEVIGYTRSGRPIFPIAGAEGEGDGDGDKSKSKDEPGTGAKPDPKDWEAEAEKWRDLARKHEGRAKENADAAKRLQELEDKDKSESQKFKDEAEREKKRADDAELRALRLEVAGEKGLTPAQAKRLVGSSKEELEADADELLETFGKAAESGENGKKPPAQKPKERLKGGSEPDGDEDKSVADVVKSIPRL